MELAYGAGLQVLHSGVEVSQVVAGHAAAVAGGHERRAVLVLVQAAVQQRRQRLERLQPRAPGPCVPCEHRACSAHAMRVPCAWHGVWRAVRVAWCVACRAWHGVWRAMCGCLLVPAVEHLLGAAGECRLELRGEGVFLAREARAREVDGGEHAPLRRAVGVE